MKILVTRVSSAKLLAEKNQVAAISCGLVVFVGLEKDDTESSFEKAAEKIVNLRIFENEKGKFHFSVKDKNYQILCVSNFTLCANTENGRRPSFDSAMAPQQAELLFNKFVDILKTKNIEVKTGVFGAHMDINMDLDGPVNIVL